MKIKNGFMVREIAGQWIVVPIGSRVVEFNGIMTLSESGAILWKLLASGAEMDDLVSAILAEYDIDEKTARADVESFIEVLTQKKLME